MSKLKAKRKFQLQVLPAAQIQEPSTGEQRALFLQLHFCLHPGPKVSIGHGRAHERTSQPGLQLQAPVCGSQLKGIFFFLIMAIDDNKHYKYRTKLSTFQCCSIHSCIFQCSFLHKTNQDKLGWNNLSLSILAYTCMSHPQVSRFHHSCNHTFCHTAPQRSRQGIGRDTMQTITELQKI